MDVREAGHRITRYDLAPLRGASILITGAGGMLGSALVESLETLAVDCRLTALDRRALDVRDREAVFAQRAVDPDFIFHCAANSLADACERNPVECREIQVGGTEHVIELARECRAQVIYPQSVFIFDGSELPVTESTKPAPMSAYGRFKLEAEQCLSAALPDSLIVRMAGFFGGDARDKNFVGTFMRWLFEAIPRGERRCQIGDRIWQPTYTIDLAQNLLLLVASKRDGVYHMGARGEASFFDVARACVDELDLSRLMSVERRPPGDPAPEIAPRPFRMVTASHRLDEEGLNRQRHWRPALAEYLARPFNRERAQKVLDSP
jgi:dTDP-4-dehydrorhamnose reductase